MPQPRRAARLGLVCALGSFPALGLAAEAGSADSNNPAAAQELPQVIVIGNAPLPGFGLPLSEIPANVQTATSQDMQRAQTLDVADYMSQKFTGVNVSESADNPFQLDINYHGFTASPLIGTPEGLSVYVDGVRVNESFGDTVNWDLIPESAISTVSLIGGSNPVFGLNTLGGALSLQTKSGHDNPGTEFEAYGGSFGRSSFQGNTGGAYGPFDYFATVHYFHEDGWRNISTTEVWQVFGKVGYQTDQTDVDLSYTYADTLLYGNGALPLSMYQYLKAQSYTPDITHNLLHFVNLTASQALAEHLLLTGNAFYRHLITDSNNGSNNDNYLDDGYPGPPIDCGGSLAEAAPLAWCSNAANQLSTLVQRSSGVGLQLTDSDNLFGAKNQAIVGADFTDEENAFQQWFLYGAFAPNHLLIYTPSPSNYQTVIDLSGSNRIFGVYLTDTFSPSELLHFNVSVRYNENVEKLGGYSVDTDIEDFGNGFNEATPLSGDHTFSRVNPAIGFTVTPSESLTLYADYNQASRAPTVVELGCSNPAQPCGLPNDFASDPDLKQVVARTFELGIRGSLAEQRLNWSADVFRTVNQNDIQFIATSTNAGYFANVGDTLRKGVDLALGGRAGRLRWNLSYSFVDATFQSPFLVSAESNSSADADGNTLVTPGDRIPLIPRNTGKLALDYQLTEKLDLGANLVMASGSYLHGNENNKNQAGGTNGEGQYIIGSGWIPSYTVVNLQGTYQLGKNLQVFARIANLLNKEYATAGFLTTNTFNPNGTFRANPNDWTNENAISPGAPFGIWAGMRLQLQ
jgi:outer membrane receptor protein involved in Fe transport